MRRKEWMTHMVARCMNPEILFENRQLQDDHLREPVVIICNHMRSGDGCLPRLLFPQNRVYSLMADDLMPLPILRSWMRSLDCIPINRKKPSTQWLRESVERIRQGASVVIFPEGTTRKEWTIENFKPGFLLLAREAGCKVLPVALDGRYRLLRRKKISILVGTPTEIRLEGTSHAQLAQECRRFKALVYQLYSEIHSSEPEKRNLRFFLRHRHDLPDSKQKQPTQERRIESIEQTLHLLLQTILRGKPMPTLTPGSPLSQAIGIDSYDRALLAVLMEETFGVAFDDYSVWETYGDLCSCVEQRVLSPHKPSYKKDTCR